MANNNTIINLTSTNGISVEELQALLAAQGITAQIKIAQPKTNDKIQYKDEEKTIGICKYDSSHEFVIADLSEEELKNAKQSGLCPHCYQVLQQAKAIKEVVGRTRKVTDNRPSADKPGFKIREIVKSHLASLNDEIMDKLQNVEFCKNQFKLRYALLMDISDMASEEVKVARMDKGHPRYSPAVYVKDERQYLLTNDLYARNLEPIEKFFENI